MQYISTKKSGVAVGLWFAGILAAFFIFGILSMSAHAEEQAPTETPVVSAPVEPIVDPEPVVDPAPVVSEEVVVGENVVDESVPPEVAAFEAPADTPSAPAPELSTDKADYHPGETATIFGKFFGAFKHVVLTIFGYSEENTNYTETTQEVDADANGSFTTTYLLDGVFRPIYTVIANAVDGSPLAQTTFTDAPNAGVDVYDQCSNDDGDGYANGDIGCRFINGNLQSQNSTYFEGDSTLQRLSINGLTPGTVHTVTLKYGTTKQGKHAYDFLTTWDASESWSDINDRCDGITTGCTTASETTLAIPHDPNGSGQFESDFTTRNFVMRGGTINSATAPTIVTGTYAGDSETAITITYTVGPANGAMCATKSNVTTCAMVLWFGAHISEGAKWTAFNGTTGAGTISGSPYHVALADFDGDTTTLPKGGGRDNQMQAGAIIIPPPAPEAHLTLVKQVTNNNGGGALATAWTLNAAGITNISGHTGETAITNAFVAPGSYDLSETGGPSGYSASAWVCTGTGIVQNGSTVTLDDTESATCTITNDDIAPTLTVIKQIEPSNDLGKFNLRIDAVTAGTGANVGDEGTTGAVPVTAGAHVVSETAGTGTSLSDYTAVITGNCDAQGNVTLALGENKTCTITNTKKGHIIVDKVTLPGGDAQSFSFTTNAGSNFSLTDSAAPHDSGAVIPGTYSVAETVPAGWDQTSATCSDQSPVGAISLQAGETVTCTFTNTKRGHVIIVKDVISNPDPTDFTFQNNFGNGNPASFLLDEDAEGTLPSSRSFEVLPGAYAVSEDALAHWQNESATCDQGETIQSIDVGAGETVTCTFVNEKLINITLVKNTIGGNGDFDFDATGVGLPADIDLTTVAGTVQQTFTDLDQDNTYTIVENVPTGWVLTSATCTGAGNTPASITPDPNENVTCTFTNTKKPTLTLQKTVVNDNGGTALDTAWTLSASGATPITGVEGVAAVTGAIVTAGAYDLSESNGPTGYSASVWVCVGGVQNDGDTVTLGAGDNATCTITNNDIPAHLIVIKHVDNGTTGATATAANFTTTISNVTTATPVAPGAEAPGVDNTLTTIGAYSVDEGAHVGYTKGLSADCSGSIALGQTKTCTITNTAIAPKLTVIKVLDNGNTGSTNVLANFQMKVDGGNVAQGAANTFAVGAHTVSETGPDLPSGYTTTFSGACNGTANVTLALADDVTCTITNTAIAPQLKLVKTVINLNGGTKVVADFPLSVDALGVTSGVFNPVTVGSHTATETSDPGYAASAWGTDCAANGSVSLMLGQSKTCTITNDDIQPQLTIIKELVNDNGGNAVVSDFTFTVTGNNVSDSSVVGTLDPGVTITLDAGNYSVVEDAHPGYDITLATASCIQSIAVGEHKTCTIRNNDRPAHVILNKVVTKDNGGTAGVNDFGLTVGGASVTSGENKVVNSNTPIALNEAGLAGYSFVSITGDAKCPALLGGTVTLTEDETVTCTITNDDDAPSLTLVKEVENDNGGTAVATDFTLTATGYDAQSPDAGTYDLSESGPGGYTQTSLTCDNTEGQVTSVTLGLGEDVICTFVNADDAPTLTLNKVVTNNNGGDADESEFTLTATGPTGFSGVGPTVGNGTSFDAGQYNLSESNLAGYAPSAWSCAVNGGQAVNGASVTLGLGDDGVCTITNDDIAPILHLRKVVINDNGGLATVADFTLTANGAGANDFSGVSPVDSGAGLLADTFALSETNLAGYIASDWVCVGGTQNGASITVGIGQEATCTITNNDTPGHFTGGGSVFPDTLNPLTILSGIGKSAKDTRVTHGFTLHCDASRGPNRLEVNWGPSGKAAQKFHLLNLTSAVCTDNPAIDPQQPNADFDTITGRGTGRFNGVDGATIDFIFDDAGEPGKFDRAKMLIKNVANQIVLDTVGMLYLNVGNQQAHQDN